MRSGEAFRAAETRLRLARAMRWSWRASLFATVTWLLGMVVARVVFEVTAFQWSALGVVAIGVLAGTLGYFWRRVSRFDVASQIDHRLELREQLSTMVFAEGSPDGVRPPHRLREVLQTQAERAVGSISRHELRAAFPVPAPLPSLALLFLLAVATYFGPLLPSLRAGEAEVLNVAVKDAKRVRESARTLAKTADELERATALAQLEEARKAARRVALEARKLQKNPLERREALSRMTRLQDELKAMQRSALGRDLDAEPFGRHESLDRELDRLSELARELDALDLLGLDLDLQELGVALEAEASSAQAEGRAPRVDIQKLEDLIARTEAARRALAELEGKSLAGLDPQVTAEQLELLRKIAEKLDELAKQCRGQGNPLTPEALGACAGGLCRLSTADLEKILKALQSLEAMGMLCESVGDAKACMGGMGSMPGAGSPGQNALTDLLQRLGSGGGMGPQAGLGQGGQATRGPDDRETEVERVAGQLDPKGQLGKKIPFKGIPKPAEAREELHRTLRQAAADAESSLAHDELPPSARDYVRRYFDSMTKD